MKEHPMYRAIWTPRLDRRILAVLAGLLGAALLTALGIGVAKALSTGTPLDALVYSIRTQYAGAATGPCTSPRTVSTVVGVPTPVDVGGTVLPDVLVTLVAVPGIGAGPDVLELAVTKLKSTQLRASVEVVISPDSSSPERVAAGPDGCETGLPNLFSATVTSSEKALCVLATTVGPTSALSVLGASYDAVGNARANATEVNARLSPVPALVRAKVDINGPTDYHAVVKTSSKTDLNLQYGNSTEEGSTKATARVATFPGDLDLIFTEKKIAYVASAAMTKVDLFVETAAPATWTTRMNADLTGVPAAATIDRPTPTRMTFTTPTGAGIAPTKIGQAVMDFSQFDPAPAWNLPATLPTLAAKPDQYLVTQLAPHFTVAKAKVLGLARADIDSGDPVLVDVQHIASPFHVVADLVGVQTRKLDVDIVNLPATAKVTYSPTTQDFTYSGSGTIDSLNAKVTSSAPFVGAATSSTLDITSLPTGLVGKLDSANKTFTATTTGGKIGSLEVGLTSGGQEKLAPGVQGILVNDHAGPDGSAGSYRAFVRILDLEKATVSWGSTQLAEVLHREGRFELRVDTDTVDIDGLIQDLPHRAYVSYGPAAQPPGSVGGSGGTTPGSGGPGQVGDVDQGPPSAGPPVSRFIYDGSKSINSLRFDVTSPTPLFGRATEAHLDATGVPKGLTVTLFRDRKHVDVTTSDGDPIKPKPSTLGYLNVEVCSAHACDLEGPVGDVCTAVICELDPDRGTEDPSPDGLEVVDEATRYHARAKIIGLQSLSLDWADDKVGVDLVHPARPFNITLLQAHLTPPAGPPTGETYPYTTNTGVTIAELPAQTTLTYNPKNQRIAYQGSSEMPSIVADHTSTGKALVGDRGRFAHLDVRGLPKAMDLAFQFSPGSKSLAATVTDPGGGTASIKHLALDILSDPSLLAMPSVASNLILNAPHGATRDGLMLWDLHDTQIGINPVLDPFILLVRASNVDRISYEQKVFTRNGDEHAENVVEVGRTTKKDLYLEIRRHGDNEEPRTLDGFPHQFKYEGLHIWYDGAPSDIGFAMKRREDPDTKSQLYVDIWGSEVGAKLNFDTDFGLIKDLTVDVRDIPIGTVNHPGIQTCISANSLDCLPAPYNVVTGTEVPFSFAVDVNSPIALAVSLKAPGGDTLLGYGTKMTVNVDDTRIEKRLHVGAQGDTTGQNSNVVYLDTDYGSVKSDVRIFDDGTLSTEINAPPGTRAKRRYVEIEKEGILKGRNSGFALCPHGFTAHAYALFGNRFSLNDDLCVHPSLTSISPQVLIADGQPHTYDLRGAGFASDSNGFEGAHLCLTNGTATYCGSPTTSTQWFNPFFMRGTVTLPVGTTGTFRAYMQNPTDARFSNDSPDTCYCAMRVVAP